ncbi:hypothetical protein, unknown function [Leishmania donovani]|uniref:Uncharacterized protein n=1 Tax=Leishmania donovani TaxID=5661 RepID=E9B8U1_LEIDO|nr:hypothetical protein, unknown function [Leishmania donovani]CBZ31664.1 hypothetical protein, unknown function [Leishmania donovani]
MDRPLSNAKDGDGVAVSGPPPAQATRLSAAPVVGASGSRRGSCNRSPGLDTTTNRVSRSNSRSTSGSGVAVGGAHPGVKSTGAVVPAAALKAFGMKRRSGSDAPTSPQPPSVPSAPEAPLRKPRRGMGEAVASRDSPACVPSLSVGISIPSRATDDTPPVPTKKKSNGQTSQSELSGQQSPNCRAARTSRVHHGRIGVSAQLRFLSVTNCNSHASLLSGSGSRIGCSPVLREFARESFSLATASDDDVVKEDSACGQRSGTTATSSLSSSSTAPRRHSLTPHSTNAQYGARAVLIPTPPAVAAVGVSSLSSPHDLGGGSRPDSHAPVYHGSDAARRPSLLAGVKPAHVSTSSVGSEGRGESGCAQPPSVSRAGLSSSPFARCPSLVSSTNAGSPRDGTAKRSLAGCPFAAARPAPRSPSLSFADTNTSANTTASSPSSHTESTMAFGTSTTVMALASATGTAAMPRLNNAAAKKSLMSSAVASPHLMVPQRLASLASRLPATTCSAATTSTTHTATRDPKIISEAVLTTSTTATSITPTKGRRFNLRLSMFPVTASVATTAADCRVGSTLSDATHAITESAAVAAMTRASATAQYTVLEPLTSPSSSKSIASGITSAVSPDKLHPGPDGAQLCRRLRGSSELVASMPSMPSAPERLSGPTPLAEASTVIQGSHQPSPTQLSRQSQLVDYASKEDGSIVDMPVLTGRAASPHIPDAPPAASAAPPPLMRSSLSSVCSSSAVNSSLVRRQGSMPLLSASHAGAAMMEAIGDGHGGQQASMVEKCGSAASPPRMPHHPQHAASEDGTASENAVLEVRARGTESPHLRSTTIASKLSPSGGGGTQYEAPPTLSSLDIVGVGKDEEGGVGADVVFVAGSSPLGEKPMPVPAHHSSGSNDRDDAAAPRGGVPRLHNRLSHDVALFPQTTPLQSALSTTPSRSKASSSAAGQRGLLTLFAELPSASPAATEAPADPNGDCGGSAVAAARDVPRLREGTGIGAMPSILTACPADFGGGMDTAHLSGRLHAGLPAPPGAPTLSPRLEVAERDLQHQDSTAPPPTFSSHTAEVPALAACASSPDGADVVARAKDAAAAKAMPPSSCFAGPLAESGLVTPLRTVPGRPKPGTSGSRIDSRLCTPSSDTSFLESKAGRLICSSTRWSVPTVSLVSTTQLPSNGATALLPTQGLATPRAPSAYPRGTHSSPKALSSVTSSAASSLLMRGAAAKSPTAGASRPPLSPPHLAAAAAAAPTPSTASDIAPVALLALADVASLSPRSASLGDGNKVALAAAQHRRTLDALAAGTLRSTAGSVSVRQTSSLSPFPPAKAPDDDTATWATPRSGSNSRVAVSTPNPPQRAGVFPSMPPPPSLSNTGGVSSLASHGVCPTTTANAHRFCDCSDGSLSDIGGSILTHHFVSSSRLVFDAPTTPKLPLHTGASAATAATAGAVGSSADVSSDDVTVAVGTSCGHDEPPAHDSLTFTEDAKGDERAPVGGGGSGAATVSTEAGYAAENPAHTQKTDSSLSSGRGNSTGGSGGDGDHRPSAARSFSGQATPTHRTATDNTAHHLSATCVMELPAHRPIAYLSAEKKREPHCRHHDDSKQPQRIEPMTSSQTAQSDSGAGRPRLTSLSSMTASANGDPLHLSTSACSSSKDVPENPSKSIVTDDGDDSARRLHKSKMPSLLDVDRLVSWLRSTSENGKSSMVRPSAEVDIGADGSATEGPGADAQLQASSTTAADTLAVSSAKGTSLRGTASKTMPYADGSISTNSPLLVRDGTRAGPSMCAPSLEKQSCFGDPHTTAHTAPTVPNAAAVVTATALSLQLSQSSTVSVHASVPADVGGVALCGSLDARGSACPLAVPSLPAGCQPHRQRAASTLGRGGPHAEIMGSSKGARAIVDKNASAAECDCEADETRSAAAEFSASTAAAASQLSVAQGDHNTRSSSRLSVAPSAPSDTAKAAEAAAGRRSVASAPASTEVRDAGDKHANDRCGGGPSRPVPLSSAMTSDGHRTDAAASHTQSQLHESSNSSLPTPRSTFLGSVPREIKRWAIAVLRRHRNRRSSGRCTGTEKDGTGSEVSSSSQASSLCARTREGRSHPPAAWKALEVKSARPLYAGQGQQTYNLFQSDGGVAMANGAAPAPLLLPARPLVPAASSLSEAPLPGVRSNRTSRSSSATSRSSFIHTAPLTPLFYSVLDYAAAGADDGGPHTAEVPYSVFGSAARAFRRCFSSAIAGGDGTNTPEHKRASDDTTASGSLASPASSTVVVLPAAQNSVITLAAATQRNVFRGTPLSRRTFLSALSGTAAPTLDAAGNADEISLAPPMPDLPACPITTKTVSMLQPGSDQLSGRTSTLHATDSTATSLSATITAPSSSSLRTTQPSGSSGAAAATALSSLSREPKYAPTPTNAADGAQSPGSAPRLLGSQRRRDRSTGDRDDPLGGTAAHQNVKADKHDQPPHHSCHLAAARLSLEPHPQSTRAPATARRPLSGCYGEDTTTIASMSRRGSAAITVEGCSSNTVLVLDAAHASALHTSLIPRTRCFSPTMPTVAAKTSCGRRGGNRRFSAGCSPLHPLAAHERWPVPTEKAESAAVAHDKMPSRIVLAAAAMPAPQVTSVSATTSTITTSTPYSVSLTDMSSGGGFERGAAGDPATPDATENRACGTLSNSAAAPSSWQRSHTGSFGGGKVNVATTTSSHAIAHPFAPSSSLPFMNSAGPVHRSGESSGSIAGGREGAVSRASVITATAPSTGADEGRSDDDAANENAATPPPAATRTAGANYSPPPLLSCDASPALFHLSSPLAFLHDRNESFTSGGIPALMLDDHDRNSQLSSPKRPRSDTGVPQPAALCSAAARGSVSRHQQDQQDRVVPVPAPPDSPARPSRAPSCTGATAAIPSPPAATSNYGVHAIVRTTAAGEAYTMLCGGNGGNGGTAGARAGSLNTTSHSVHDSPSSTVDAGAPAAGAAWPSANIPPFHYSLAQSPHATPSSPLSGAECDLATPVPPWDASGSGTRSGSGSLGGGHSVRTSSEFPSGTLSSLLYIPPELRRGPQWRHLKQHLGGLNNISSPSLSAIARHRRGRVGAARRSSSHRQAAPTSSSSLAVLAAAPGVDAGAKTPSRVSSPRSPSERCIAPTALAAGRRRVSDGAATNSAEELRFSRSFKANCSYKTLSYQVIGMRPLSDDVSELSLVSAVNNATVATVMSEWPSGNNASSSAMSRESTSMHANDVLPTTAAAEGPVVGARPSYATSSNAVHGSEEDEASSDTAAVTAAVHVSLPSRLLLRPTHERRSARLREVVGDGRPLRVPAVVIQSNADIDEGHNHPDRGDRDDGSDTEASANTHATSGSMLCHCRSPR